MGFKKQHRGYRVSRAIVAAVAVVAVAVAFVVVVVVVVVVVAAVVTVVAIVAVVAVVAIVVGGGGVVSFSARRFSPFSMVWSKSYNNSLLLQGFVPGAFYLHQYVLSGPVVYD